MNQNRLNWFYFSINGEDVQKEIITHLENGATMLNLSQIQNIKRKAVENSQRILTASTRKKKIDKELITRLANDVVEIQKDYTDFSNDLKELNRINKEL